MSNEVIEFGEFRLDPGQRRLSRAGAPIDVSHRYFDALLLLASHPGELVTKDRFMAEVWAGVPVTDEALTQCIRSLRRALGDEASRPRFIETVPKHGYRFVARVKRIADAEVRSVEDATGAGTPAEKKTASFLLITSAGLVGGAAAGLIGGIGYGLLAAALSATSHGWKH